MTVLNFLSNAKLIEYIESHMDVLLDEKGVHPLGSYCYLNLEEYNPEYSGLESLISSPLLDQIDDENIDQPSVGVKVYGSDFVGLMKMVRLCIGYQLLYWKNYSEPSDGNKDLSWLILPRVGDSSFFLLHSTNSHILLNIASDRIRSYLISALNDADIDCDRIIKKHDSYDLVFSKIKDFLLEKEIDFKTISEKIDQAKQLAAELQKYRKKRNKLVHELTSKEGKSRKEDLTSPRWSMEDYFLPHEEVIRRFREDEDIERLDIDESIETAVQWYVKLVEMANCVSYIEIHIRQQKAR